MSRIIVPQTQLLQILCCCLTTAEITYHLPDHPLLLQTYVWQDVDHVPDFPVLNRFLDYWQRTLDGKVHSVILASTALTAPTEFRFADGLFHLQ